MALKVEKVKFRLLPAPLGSVGTIDWCIMRHWLRVNQRFHNVGLMAHKIKIILPLSKSERIDFTQQ